METKKSSKANLENKRIIYFQIGFVVTLALVFAAFEMKTTNRSLTDFSSGETLLVNEQIVNTVRKPEPPAPKPKIVYNIFKISTDPFLTDSFFTWTELPMDSVIEGYGFIEHPIVDDTDDIVVPTPQFAPEFPGGNDALLKYLSKNTIFPEIDKEIGTQGIAYIQFVVKKDGSIGEVKVLRGVSPTIDAEAIRVVKTLPKWKPGKMGTREVNCYFTIPIRFKLSEN